MQVRKSIIRPITLVFITLFFVLIILLTFSVYRNMSIMHNKISIERINGISNVIQSKIEHELESAKHAVVLLTDIIKNQYTNHHVRSDIGNIIINQSYLVDQIELIVVTDEKLNIVFLNDKHKVIPELNFGDLALTDNKSSDYFINRIFNHILIFGQKKLKLPDGDYVIIIAFDSAINKLEFEIGEHSHFRIKNHSGMTILQDSQYDKFIKSKDDSTYDHLHKEVIVGGNKLEFDLFCKITFLEIFGYGNLFLTGSIVIILILVYSFITTYLLKNVIIPLRKLKQSMSGSVIEVSQDPLISKPDFKDEKNEISCIVDYFNFFINNIQLYAEEAESNRQKLKNIINFIKVGIVEIDADDFIINDINDCALDMLGLTYDECVGTHCYEKLCNHEECYTSLGISCLIEDTTASPHSFECSMRNVKTGVEIPVLKSLVKIPNDDITLILVSFINIFDLKVKEEELKRAVGRADRATIGKTIMLGNVSHDIKNELTILKGNAEKLHSDNTLTDEQIKLIDVVIDSADTIATAVKLMQERTLLETGQSKLSSHPVDLCDIMNRLYRTNIIKCKDKQIEFKYNGVMSGDTYLDSLYINVDSSKLIGVLANLFDNAIKFTSYGYVECSVIIMSETDSSVNIKFRVKDTGIGITKEACESVFKIYEQANENIQTIYGGTGIGLSICQHYINLMGGVITVDSKVDEGSVFSFDLTFEKCKAELFELESKEQYDKNTDQLKIIVAEDSKAIQQVINDKLQQLNCEVTIVANGRDAVNRIRNAYYDILFLDIRMPIMSGMEAIRIIRDEKFNIPTIALTANSSETDVEKYIKSGFDDCVPKPVSVENLNAVIMKYKNRQLMDIEYIEKNYKTSEWFLQVLDTVKDEFKLNIEMLNEFENDSNYSNLNHYLKASHSIKSISSQMGMESVRHISHILETKFASGINFQDANDVQELISLLQVQFRKSLEYYDQYLKT